MKKKEELLARYLAPLLRGDRKACRKVIEETLQMGIPANAVYSEIIWPIMIEIDKLERSDRISAVEEHLATRINRTIVNQLQNKLPRREQQDKKVAICCAEAELQELGAQMMADLFESDGCEVRFLGGGLSNDDVYGFVNEYGPDLLVLYGTTPKQAPQTRLLIDTIKAVNAWPSMRIMVAGGIFARADGLWEEIGADAFATTPLEALANASDRPDAYVAQRTINRRKKRTTATVAETKRPQRPKRSRLAAAK